MARFNDYIKRKENEYGKKFDASELASQFIPFFNSHERVKVQFPYGETLTGTIGVTTGWKPVFLLMRTRRSIGSPYTLHSKDKIVAVKEENKYREL